MLKPQLIKLSQLHNHYHQQNVTYTGLGLYSEQQLQKPHLPQNQNQHRCYNLSFFSLLSQGFASQIKQQSDEIDQLIQVQGEQLRQKLVEKRQRHCREILNVAEEMVTRRLREKEAEVEKTTRRHAELEAQTAKLVAEVQVWQAKARAQEAVAASLQAQLQLTIMASVGAKAGCHGCDDVSCAVEGETEDTESAYMDPDRMEIGVSIYGPGQNGDCIFRAYKM